MTIESNNIALTSDYHVPAVDGAWLERLLVESQARKTEDLAIIGDLWDADSLSIYPKYTGESWSFEQEIGAVQKVVDVLAQSFKRIWICQGNHEYRWARIHEELRMAQLWRQIKLPEDTRVSMNDYMLLNGNWRLVHPRNYRQQPGSVANALALKYHMNIANTHGHYAWGPELDKESKSYWIMDLGGFFDPEYIEYMQRSSTYPALTRGFGFLIDNIPEMIKERRQL
jgi:hypothetical protein